MNRINRENTVHLCVDMQRIFAEQTAWQTPWVYRVMPQIMKICKHAEERNVFTRFIPAQHPGQGRGRWKEYYERWADMTLDRLDLALIDLVPELKKFTPLAKIVDKHVYSPWIETNLHGFLQKKGIDTVIITGGEAEVCVLATVLGAVDFGYRIILASDALCSSNDATYDATMSIYESRYGVQIEVERTETILSRWN